MYSLAKNETEKQSVIKIYNPIDREDTLKKADIEVNDYPFNNDLPTFVTVGTVYPQKGYDRLLNVHKKLIDEGLKHQLLIIGDGYDFNVIQEQLNQLGLQATAKMLGFSSNPYPYMKKRIFISCLPDMKDSLPSLQRHLFSINLFLLQIFRGSEIFCRMENWVILRPTPRKESMKA